MAKKKPLAATQPQGAQCAVCGQPRCCGAKLRSPGAKKDWRCHKAPMPNGKCYRHGGKTPAGIAAGAFKTGAHSKLLKHLPQTLAPHFNPDDPKLIELREELALVDAGVVSLLEELKAGHTAAPRWNEVDQTFAAFERAQERKDGKGMATALDKHKATIAAGKTAADRWAEILRLVDQRSRLVAVESRRRRDEQEMVERAEFGRFAKAFLSAVAVHVDDRALRGKIQTDVLRILAISQVPIVQGETA